MTWEDVRRLIERLQAEGWEPSNFNSDGNGTQSQRYTLKLLKKA